MKKVGTATGNAGQEYFSTETASTDNSESVAGNVRHHAAQSSGTGNRGAFALDQSLAQAVGTRSDRGQCAQGAVDRGRVGRKTIGWMRRPWRGWRGSIPSCCIR